MGPTSNINGNCHHGSKARRFSHKNPKHSQAAQTPLALCYTHCSLSSTLQTPQSHWPSEKTWEPRTALGETGPSWEFHQRNKLVKPGPRALLLLQNQRDKHLCHRIRGGFTSWRHRSVRCHPGTSALSSPHNKTERS